MVFCNRDAKGIINKGIRSHNPYFNRWFSAIKEKGGENVDIWKVTILILIDGFLQYGQLNMIIQLNSRHNPYFNRWFSAIYGAIHTKNNRYCHNPYFNRWFSAIM